jgi:transposase-like protein
LTYCFVHEQPDVIMIAVRWYLRYALSYRDVEELLAERGIEVDHVTIYRWVQRFTPLLIDAARSEPSGPQPRYWHSGRAAMHPLSLPEQVIRQRNGAI